VLKSLLRALQAWLGAVKAVHKLCEVALGALRVVSGALKAAYMRKALTALLEAM